MDQPDGAPSRARLEGTLERITFHNEENGYTIARLIPKGKSYETTIVGNMQGPNVGASLVLEGHWKTHAKYGKQFVVEDYREELPATVEGLRRYLGSGLIKGVGPVSAERIVEHFGLETLTVIDEAPERLREVPGIGDVRADKIAAAWVEQREIKEIMIFLQSHGVTTGLAVRIYKTYGDQSVAVVREDPYRLAREVFGIGFLTADRIARAMGLAPDSPKRIEAGLLFALGTMADQGHVYAPRPELVDAARKLLEIEEPGTKEAVDGAIDRLAEAEAVILETLPAETMDLFGASGDGPAGTRSLPAPGVAGRELRGGSSVSSASAGSGSDARPDSALPEATANPLTDLAARTAVYLPPFFYAEKGVANRLREMLRDPVTRLGQFAALDWESALAWMDGRLDHPLAVRQREAVRRALSEKVSILTGGPGTGKTTTVRAILEMLEAKGGKPLLAAPTGRAAKRLAETTGREAKTIHRLLEFGPSEGRMFKRHEENPLNADLVVVDEVSMVDLLLMNHLCKAIASDTHLLLVGDVDQLPSVGAGNVLRDLIDSGVVPLVHLDEIFRQAQESHIIVNAHRINRGKTPVVDKASRDFFLFGAEDAEKAADWVVDVVSKRIPGRWPQYDPLRDIQVLSPMHRGAAGVSKLNERLQEALNPPAPNRPEVRFGGKVFRLGDKLMQIRNNYDKDVFNGDVGRMTAIDAVDQRVELRFDGQAVDYEFGELDELVHAFACSTHKSQGSEYPVVVMTLLPAHYMMLQRNLLYTGVTRARELCVIVGSRKAMKMAVNNDKVAQRYSGLARRLRG